MSACIRSRKARNPDKDIPHSASQSDTDILVMRGDRITESDCRRAMMRAKGRLKMAVQAYCMRVGTACNADIFVLNKWKIFFCFTPEDKPWLW